MPTKYPVVIDPRQFNDRAGLRKARHFNSRSKILLGVQGCPKRPEKSQQPKPPPNAALTKISVSIGSKESRCFLKRSHRPLAIRLTTKTKDSAHANTRLANVKKYLESCIVDRKKLYSDQLQYRLILPKVELSRANIRKTFPMDILPRVAQILFKQEVFKDMEGVFLFHLPGTSNIRTLQSAQGLHIQLGNLTGAQFGKQGTRTQGITYITTLPPGPMVMDKPNKKTAAIFSHEIAHALFLPHASARTGSGSSGQGPALRGARQLPHRRRGAP